MKKSFTCVFFFLFSFILANQAMAVCPVCTVTICMGLGLSRWLGIDDVISGIWIGGLIISIVIGVLEWLQKKKIYFKLKELFVSILVYSSIIFIFYSQGMVGIPANTLFCVDKLLLGIFLGSVALLASIWINNYLKKKNNGRVYFPFQKVVIPVCFLLILSGIFYFII